MTVAVRVTRQDGSVLMASSWQAWRDLAHLHMRVPCFACDGTGHQEWCIEASGDQPTRWFPEVCRSCRGQGWRL